MKVFIVLSCIALAAAKPEGGYSYNQPGGSFSHGSSSSLLQGQGSSLSAGLNLPSSGSGQAFNGASSFGNSGPGQSFAGSFGSGSFSPFGGADQTIVQKHIYVHVPPQDQEEYQQPIQIAPVQKQKHYKIIFIKAPSAPAINPQALQRPQVQNEEKTLVYVLVKKPESLNEIQQLIPSAPPTPPSKPEVYFIKYKAQKDSSGPISSGPILSGSSASGSILSGHHQQPSLQAHGSHSSGPVIQSLPSSLVSKPSPVYGPAH